jgi:hypothetical protein
MPCVRQSLCGTNWKKFIITLQGAQTCFLQQHPILQLAQHLLDEAHPFGPIHEIMQVLHHHSKSPYLNTMEKFYIYAEYTDISHLNDEHTIFDTLINTT